MVTETDSGSPDQGPATARGRVVLADDDVLFREGLASLLTRHGFEVVGQADNGVRLLELVREHVPDLVIVDVRMPPSGATEGLVAARRIRESFPSIAILVLSAYAEVDQAMELLSGGERIGYLLKSSITEVAEMTEALERISKGGVVVDPMLVREVFAVRRREDPLDELSPREREVLELMAEGLSNAGIAQKLWITEGTVEKHVRSVLAKLRLPVDHRRVLAVLTYLGSRNRPLP